MTEINYFWHGESFSKMEILSFTSAWKNNHQPVIWTYEQEIIGTPSFVILKEASTIIPKEKFNYFLNVLKLPLANISDILRYSILLKYGGIYSDTDIIFLDNLDLIKEEEYFCSSYEYNYGELANGCLMKLKANSSIAQYLFTTCNARIREMDLGIPNVNFEYCYLGPFLVQKCAAEMHVKVLSFDMINPISWRWVNKIIAFTQPDYKFILKNIVRILIFKKTSGYRLTKNTLAIHLSNEIWKNHSFDKDGRFHKWSIYEKLKTKFLYNE